jgi:two-component system, NarL family, nitrate/nitrite response regulator NarL
LIAISVRLYREGLATILAAQPSLRVEGTAATSMEALAAVRVKQPDAAIIDVSLDGAIDLIRTLRTENERLRVLAFAVREEISAILEYAEAGADGFVVANGTIADLIEALERAVAGELLCSPKLAAELLRRATRRAGRPIDVSEDPGLTNREGQVFALLKRGQSNKEIASSLNIAEATVKNHVHHLLEKLQVTTRGQAAATMGRCARATLRSRPPFRRTN